MPRGFSFGATVCGFFIPAAAFFGGMVVAGGVAEAGSEREDEAAMREGALGVNQRGTAGNGRIGGEIGGIWEKPAGRCWCRWQGGPGVGLALPRDAGAPDRTLPRRGRHGSAGSFVGLAFVPAILEPPVRAGFWPRVQFPCQPYFGRRFGSAGGDALTFTVGPMDGSSQKRFSHKLESSEVRALASRVNARFVPLTPVNRSSLKFLSRA
jgi:hypothetical protein